MPKARVYYFIVSVITMDENMTENAAKDEIKSRIMESDCFVGGYVQAADKAQQQ